MLFPFLPVHDIDDAVRRTASDALRSVRPFDVELISTAWFGDGKPHHVLAAAERVVASSLPINDHATGVTLLVERPDGTWHAHETFGFGE